MAEEPKKISFGFSKLTKKPSFVPKQPAKEEKVQLIDCLEGQSIKVKNEVEVKKGPLIIPIRDTNKNLLDRVKDAKKGKEIGLKAREVDERPDEELSIDELAARELLRDAQKQEEHKNGVKVHTLPVNLAEEKFVAEGKAEPTADDYENVPIGDFGMAMLRGMGWSEQTGIGKNPKTANKTPLPDLRPKGLGLGADRMAKAAKPKPTLDKNGKELQLEKNGFAKIIAGAHIGKYCEVQGFDDEAGRVIAKTALKGEILTLNEFLIVPVSKEEYTKNSKVINNAKYDEFKQKEERGDRDTTKNIKTERKNAQNEIKREKSETREVGHDSRNVKSSTVSYGRPVKKENKSDSEIEIIDSDSDRSQKNYKKHENKYEEKRNYDKYEEKRKKDKFKEKEHNDRYEDKRNKYEEKRNYDKYDHKINKNKYEENKNKYAENKMDKYEDRDITKRRSRSRKRSTSSEHEERSLSKKERNRKNSSSSEEYYSRKKSKERSKNRKKSKSSNKDKRDRSKSKNRSRSRSPKRKEKKHSKKSRDSSSENSSVERKHKKSHKKKSKKHRKHRSSSSSD